MKSPTYIVADNLSRNKYAPIVVGVLVVGGVLASYFFVIKPILEGVGIKETKYDKALPKMKGFDPNFYKSNLSKVTISTSQAQKIAGDIFMSSGWATSSLFGFSFIPLNDDEERLHNAISRAGSEYNLSKVADLFQKETGQSMISYILKFADNSDTETIYRIIKSW